MSKIICKVIKYARSFICSLYDISSFLPVFFALSANTSSNKMPLLNVIFTKSQCQVSNDLCHWRDLVQKPQYPRFFFGFQIISAYASKNVPHKEEIMKEKIKNKEKKWNKIAQGVNTVNTHPVPTKYQECMHVCVRLTYFTIIILQSGQDVGFKPWMQNWTSWLYRFNVLFSFNPVEEISFY